MTFRDLYGNNILTLFQKLHEKSSLPKTTCRPKKCTTQAQEINFMDTENIKYYDFKLHEILTYSTNKR